MSANDWKPNIITKLYTYGVHPSPKISENVTSESLLKDLKAALKPIFTGKFTKVLNLLYTLTKVILEMRGSQMKTTRHEKHFRTSGGES